MRILSKIILLISVTIVLFSGGYSMATVSEDETMVFPDFEQLDSIDSRNIIYSAPGEFMPIEEFSCIDVEQNRLTIPGNDKLIMNLYDRIDQITSLGMGQISILHIGGSHVQAGIFSHRLRQDFRWFIGDFTGCKGIIFPYRTMGTNAPTNYSMSTTGSWTKARCIDRNPSLPLGLSGAAIRTHSADASVYFDLKSSEDYPWEYNRLIVLGDDDYKGIYPKLVCNGDTLIPTTFENGAWIFQLPDDKLASNGRVIFPEAGSSPLTFRGLIPLNDMSGLVYNEAGINGASVPAWLRCKHFENEIKYIKPDIVFLGIGINDANVSPSKFDKEEFKANYRKLINKIKRVNPNAVFIFITNNDCKLNMRGYGNSYNPNTLKVEKAFMELAEEYSGAVWNLFRVMGGPGSSKEWVNQGLMQSDRIHFTRLGYQVIADLLFNAFVADYRDINNEDETEEIDYTETNE